MLKQVLQHINNWFEVDVQHGVYTVEDGGITLPFLQEGQYFRVLGSVFNDGVYQYPASGLTDETFDGSVWALAIPADALKLVDDIEQWQERYGKDLDSPYTSESMTGAYSYTKSTSASGGWRAQFSGRLKEYRKI